MRRRKQLGTVDAVINGLSNQQSISPLARSTTPAGGPETVVDHVQTKDGGCLSRWTCYFDTTSSGLPKAATTITAGLPDQNTTNKTNYEYSTTVQRHRLRGLSTDFKSCPRFMIHSGLRQPMRRLQALLALFACL